MPELEPILPSVIDSTMMSAFRACPRKFYNEFVLGLRPPGLSIDLHAGACFATALEVFYVMYFKKKLPFDRALNLSRAKFFIDWGDVEPPEGKRTYKTKDRMWDAVEQYLAQYPPDTDHVQPYVADGFPTYEFTFSIPLDPADGFPLNPQNGEPFLYSGRFDMLGAYMGRPCVRDEKTSGRSPSGTWADTWDLRSQFIGYCWACQQLGIDLNTVIVRGVTILKDTTPLVEAVKTFPPHMLDRWYFQLQRDLHRLVSCWESGYFDYNLGDSCTSFGNCVFAYSCKSQEPEAWLHEFEVRRWNPLSKNPLRDPDALIQQLDAYTPPEAANV